MNITVTETKMSINDRLALARASRKGGKRFNPLEKWNSSDKKSYRLAIDAKCWECSHAQREEITDCRCTSCPLHSVRPYQKG